MFRIKMITLVADIFSLIYKGEQRSPWYYLITTVQYKAEIPNEVASIPYNNHINRMNKMINYISTGKQLHYN